MIGVHALGGPGETSSALHIDDLSLRGGFKDIWSCLKRLEVLSIFPICRTCYKPKFNFFDGIALPHSRVRDLTLQIGTSFEFRHAALLGAPLGTRIRQLSLRVPRCYSGIDFVELLSEIRTACPNASIRVRCQGFLMLEAMKALRDLLIELHIDKVFVGYRQTTELRHRLECAAFCTSLGSIDVLLEVVYDGDAENFLEVLLSHIGHHLEQLTLGLLFEKCHPPETPIHDISDLDASYGKSASLLFHGFIASYIFALYCYRESSHP